MLSRAAPFMDQTLPLATERGRREALEQALGLACEDAVAWVLGQR
jgi:hypothetical protein